MAKRRKKIRGIILIGLIGILGCNSNTNRIKQLEENQQGIIELIEASKDLHKSATESDFLDNERHENINKNINILDKRLTEVENYIIKNTSY